MKIDVDPAYPTLALSDCGYQLHMLSDFFSFSGEDFDLSDRARAGVSNTLLAIADALDRIEALYHAKPKAGKAGFKLV